MIEQLELPAIMNAAALRIVENRSGPLRLELISADGSIARAEITLQVFDQLWKRMVDGFAGGQGVGSFVATWELGVRG
jgi:hypothetical protein